MVKFKSPLMAAAIAAIFALPAAAASFDCSKAALPSEKAICANTGLAELDVYLSRYYAAAQEGLKDGASCLKTDQRNWVKKVRNACGKDVACLRKAHLERLAVLDGLQPGASALKNIELPKAAILVAAIPPEAEAAPGTPSRSFEASGQLVHEMNDINNMGLAVKGEDGGVDAFVFEISLGDSANHGVVQSLMESEPQSRFLVRGAEGPEGGFADGACRFVYRLAQ